MISTYLCQGPAIYQNRNEHTIDKTNITCMYIQLKTILRNASTYGMVYIG